MRFVQIASLLLSVLVICFAGMAGAADDDPVTAASILAAAKCPLTEEQVKTLEGIEPGGDMRTLMSTINSMFTEEQVAALKAKLGTSPARGNMEESPRNLMQVIILEKAGVPLTEKQVSEMQNMQMGQGGMQQMNELYTEAQREAMSQYMGGPGMGRPGMGGEGTGGPPPAGSQ